MFILLLLSFGKLFLPLLALIKLAYLRDKETGKVFYDGLRKFHITRISWLLKFSHCLPSSVKGHPLVSLISIQQLMARRKVFLCCQLVILDLPSIMNNLVNAASKGVPDSGCFHSYYRVLVFQWNIADDVDLGKTAHTVGVAAR